VGGGGGECEGSVVAGQVGRQVKVAVMSVGVARECARAENVRVVRGLRIIL